MKIVDLSSDLEFQNACMQFRYELDKRFGSPDIIVGVANGGMRVVQAMGYPSDKTIFVRRQRKSTVVKSRIKFGVILRGLPVFLSDIARVLEVAFREKKFELNRGGLESRAVEFVGSRRRTEFAQYSVLVIDDAVDSGGTFFDVIGFLRNIYPNSVFVTAALSQTFKFPAYNVDFTFYKRTLLRCPWAMDARR